MPDPLSEPPRPLPAPGWRDRLANCAESLDLTPTRLVVGLVALVAVGLAGWKLLAPPAPPPEMRLPFVSTTTVATEPGPGGSSTAGEATTTTGSGPAEQVVVHVAGAVARPGVHRLPPGARVVDAVDAAGGAAGDAELGRLNLAAPLEDGQQVYVPRVGEVPPPPADPGTPAGGSGGTAGGSSADEPVDLNAADATELATLPGIGPAIAQAIVDYRERNGRFTTVDELLDVRGIGEAKLAELRPLVTV